jgi:hypothetical protein
MERVYIIVPANVPVPAPTPVSPPVPFYPPRRNNINAAAVTFLGIFLIGILFVVVLVVVIADAKKRNLGPGSPSVGPGPLVAPGTLDTPGPGVPVIPQRLP